LVVIKYNQDRINAILTQNMQGADPSFVIIALVDRKDSAYDAIRSFH
jgi:hypothetical protein